jgi:hypothetical protein
MVSCASKPEGSVLKTEADWVLDKLIEGEVTYDKLRITAIVLNVGGDGTFYVNAEMIPHSAVTGSINPNKIKVLMNKGEEKTFTFDFWVDSSKGSQYMIWCTNE